MIALFFVPIIFLLLALSTPNVSTPYAFTQQRSLRIKGVLSLLIVLHHCSWMLPFTKPWGTVIVGMFLFFTGYGLYKSFQEKGSDYLNNFFRKRFVKLLPPLLIATLLYLSVLIAMGQTSFSLIIRNYSNGSVPIGATWYVYALLFFYFLFYIAMKLSKNRFNVSILIIIVGLLLYTLILYGLKWEAHWFIISPALCFGMVYCYYEEKIRKSFVKRQNLFLLIITLVCLCYSVFLCTANKYEEETLALYGFMPMYWLYAVPIIISTYKIRDFESKVQNWLGGGL